MKATHWIECDLGDPIILFLNGLTAGLLQDIDKYNNFSLTVPLSGEYWIVKPMRKFVEIDGCLPFLIIMTSPINLI